MSDPSDPYAEERYDSSLARCSTLALTFDGTTLKMTGGSKSYAYLAVSGKPDAAGKFNYSRNNQIASFSGPIPAGTYWINPDELWTNGPFKRGSEDAWGQYRITVHPRTTTNTYGRGGFFIHGGKVPGSAGCIDLTSSIADFVTALDSEGARRKCQIPLTVTYPETAR
jgi:Protein of unknown function (DUF2778)